MTKRYRGVTTQTFTADGRFGVWLFIGAPFIAGLGVLWLGAESRAYGGGSVFGPAIVIILAGLASMIGGVMMLIGRRMTHEFTEVEPTAAPGPTQAYTKADWR